MTSIYDKGLFFTHNFNITSQINPLTSAREILKGKNSIKNKNNQKVFVLTRHHVPDIQGSGESSFPHLKQQCKRSECVIF